MVHNQIFVDLMDIQSNVLENVIQDMGYRVVAGKEIPLYSATGFDAGDASNHTSISNSLKDEVDENISDSLNDDSQNLALSDLSLKLLNSNLSCELRPPKSLNNTDRERDSLDSLPPVPLMSVEIEDLPDSNSSFLFSSLLSSVSDSSYVSLPIYLTSQITHSYLNDCVGEINDLLTDKRLFNPKLFSDK